MYVPHEMVVSTQTIQTLRDAGVPLGPLEAEHTMWRTPTGKGKTHLNQGCRNADLVAHTSSFVREAGKLCSSCGTTPPSTVRAWITWAETLLGYRNHADDQRAHLAATRRRDLGSDTAATPPSPESGDHTDTSEMADAVPYDPSDGTCLTDGWSSGPSVPDWLEAWGMLHTHAWRARHHHDLRALAGLHTWATQELAPHLDAVRTELEQHYTTLAEGRWVMRSAAVTTQLARTGAHGVPAEAEDLSRPLTRTGLRPWTHDPQREIPVRMLSHASRVWLVTGDDAAAATAAVTHGRRLLARESTFTSLDQIDLDAPVPPSAPHGTRQDAEESQVTVGEFLDATWRHQADAAIVAIADLHVAALNQTLTELDEGPQELATLTVFGDYPTNPVNTIAAGLLGTPTPGGDALAQVPTPLFRELPSCGGHKEAPIKVKTRYGRTSPADTPEIWNLAVDLHHRGLAGADRDLEVGEYLPLARSITQP